MNLSLRTQIVVVVGAVLVATMAVYLLLATRVLTRDKEASVYDVNALVAGTVATQVETVIDGLADKLRYFGYEYLSTPGDAEKRARSLFRADDEVLSLEVWKKGDDGYERSFLYVDQDRLASLNMSAEDLRQARKQTPVPLEAVPGAGVVLQNASLAPDLAVLRVSAATEDGTVVTADLRPERILRVAVTGSVYRVFLIDQLGRVLAHPDASRVISHADLSGLEVVKAALGEKLKRGAREYTVDGKRLFAAFARLDAGHGAVIVEVPRDEVFRATRELTSRSLLFAFGSVALALVFAIWVSRRLARPLRSLQDTMAIVSRGEFGVEVPVAGPAEVRAVGAAFNEMSRELVRRSDELARIHAQLVQSEKLSAVGELAASVVHEVKNPMVGIVGFSQLGQESETGAEMKEYFKLIEQDAQRANKILVSLLEFSRPPDVALEALGLNEVVNGALTLCRHQLQMAGVKVETSLAEGLPLVRGNGNQLRQVLLNLMLNAGQAMKDSPLKRVTITTERSPEGGVVVRIADLGPGIAPEVRERLFKPFFTTKRRGEGTGLGLSVSKGIIEAHHGHISVQTELGKGATFVLELPGAGEAAAAAAKLAG